MKENILETYSGLAQGAWAKRRVVKQKSKQTMIIKMKIQQSFVGLVILNVENGSYALAQLVESMDNLLLNEL